MRLSISPTPSNTPSNTPSVTPSNSSCPVTPSFTPTNTPTISPSGTQPCFDSGVGFSTPLGGASEISIFNDKIYIGQRPLLGPPISYSGVNIQSFVKLDLNGSIDNSFSTSYGFSGSNIFYAIEQQSDGKLIVAGGRLFPLSATSLPGIQSYQICRLNTDGSTDLNFTPLQIMPITGTTKSIHDVLVETDDSLICVGSFLGISGYASNYIVKLTSGGTVDTTVNFGTGFSDTVYNVFKQNDGKYIFVGDFTSYSGISAPGVIRLNSDFTHDATFVSTLPNTNKRGSALQSDGKLVIAGLSGTGFNNLARLNTDGSTDATYSGVTSPVGLISFMVLDENNNMYGWNSQVPNLELQKYNSDGSRNYTFDGNGFNGTVFSLEYQNGRLYCVGSFTQKNGIEANGIIVLDSTYGTIIDCTITPTPTNTATFTPTPTNTPTVTPSTSKPEVYFSLCSEGQADANGNLLVTAYADTIYNGFGSSPIAVDSVVLLDVVYSGDTTPGQFPIITFNPGETAKNIIITDNAPNENVVDLYIDLISSTGTTQTYLDGGSSFTGGCLPVCSVITFYTDGPTDAVFEFTDCNDEVHQFNGPQGFSNDYCGYINTAVVISGDGFIEDAGPCADPLDYNPVILTLGYDASNGAASCTASTQTYYLIHGNILDSGTTIYTDYSVDVNYIASAGFYSDGTYIYEVDANGQIIMIYSCTCCYQYEVTNYYTTSKTVYYTDCDGTPQSISCAGNGNQTIINCAEEGSVYTNDTECNGSTTDCVTWVQASSPCGGCV